MNIQDKARGTETKREIGGQPLLWKQVYRLIEDKREDLRRFLTPIRQLTNLRVILTGAGSSAFIGEAARGLLQKNWQTSVEAIPTTDLVTHSDLFLLPGRPSLLISFARSGNSPESVEAVVQANKQCKEIHHLVITCNKEGQLVQHSKANGQNSFCLVLPEEAHDKSLAMTGSFTSMLLSVLLIADLDQLPARQVVIEHIAHQARTIIDKADQIKEIARQDFERAVFLGSGQMLGIARECHLKLQELTDGKILCQFDSFLGFRHGPKAIVNEKTVLIYLFSENDHVFQYERDLALELSQGSDFSGAIHLGRTLHEDDHALLGIDLNFADKTDAYHIIPATLAGQLLGYYKSLDFGLDPDNPSVSGAINRVVQGVVLYPQK